MFVNFEGHFSRKVLNKGWQYYDNCFVDDISVDQDIYSAIVHGSADYDVSVNIHKGNFLNGKCNCPYALEGHNCKHMAALLYAITDENKVNEIDNTKDNSFSLLDIIESIDSDKLNEFLYDVLMGNDEMYNDFRIEFSQYFPKMSKREYKDMIDMDIESCCDRYGFIDYKASYRYEDLMGKYNEEARGLLDKEDFVTAYTISTTLLESMIGLEIDDSNGVTSNISQQAIDILCDIVDNAEDEALLNELFIYLKNEILTDRLYNNISVDLSEILDHYMDRVLFLEEIEDTLNEVLKNNKVEDRLYHYGKYIDYLCKLYSCTGRDNKILILLEEFSFDKGFCLTYIDELIKKDQVAKAIEVLKNKIMENERNSDNKDYVSKLADIYRDKSMKQEYKNILFDLFLLYSGYDIEVYKKIKELYSVDQWDKEKDNLISIVKKEKLKGEQLNKIYVEEKMFDDLFDNVKNGNIRTILTYEQYLLPKYNEQLQEIYKNDLLERAATQTGRVRYSAIADEINHLINMDDSFELVSSLLKEIEQKYFKKKRAMEDEFYRKIKNIDDFLNYNY